MVTVQEAESQIAQQEAAFAAGRKQIESVPTRVIQTRTQLLQATPASQAQVRLYESQVAIQKQAAMEQIAKEEQYFQEQAKSVKQQISQYESQVAAQRRREDAITEYNLRLAKNPNDPAAAEYYAKQIDPTLFSERLIEPVAPDVIVPEGSYMVGGKIFQAKFPEVSPTQRVEYPKPVIDYIIPPELTLKGSQKGYSLLPKGLPEISVSGGFDYLGQEAAKFTGTQPLIYSDIPGYKIRGSISPGQDIFSLLSPEEKSKIVEQRTITAKQSAKVIAPTTAILGLGLVSATGSLGLIGTSAAEQYFTPKGKETLKTSAEQYDNVFGKAFVYTLPAAELGLAAYGIRQGFMKSQLSKLQQVRPEISVGQPYQIGDNIYLRQVSEQRIPTPGFSYKTKPFISEPTLTGKEFISPRVITPMQVKLIPTESGGFTYVGVAKTGASILDPLTGLPKKIITTPYEFFGKIKPEATARLITNYPNLEITTKIEQPFIGKTTLEIGKPGKTEFFGGFPLEETKTGIKKVVSGKIPSLRRYEFEGVTRAYLKPKSLGIILPERNIKDFLIKGKSGSVSLSSFEKQPTVTEFFIPTKVSPSTSLIEGVGQSVGRLGSLQLEVPSRSVSLLIKPIAPVKQISNNIVISKPKEIQLPKEIQISKVVQIPKQVQVPKLVQVPKEIQITKSIQVPKEIQIPKQVQITKQIQIPKQIQITRQITTPIYPKVPVTITPSSALKSNKRIVPGIKLEPSFEVQIRRRGKFVKVSDQLLPRGRAIELGVKRTKAGVAQTFKLVPRGTTVSQRDTGFEVPRSLYTTTPKTIKAEKFLYTERRGKTLTTKSETRELHLFKNQKQRRKIF